MAQRSALKAPGWILPEKIAATARTTAVKKGKTMTTPGKPADSFNAALQVLAKIVGALKIKTITAQTNGMYLLESEEGYAPFEVSEAYVSKHQPQLGDYFVQYKDGYRSCSPAGVFEEGNLPIGSNAVDFGTVLICSLWGQGRTAHLGCQPRFQCPALTSRARYRPRPGPPTTAPTHCGNPTNPPSRCRA